MSTGVPLLVVFTLKWVLELPFLFYNRYIRETGCKSSYFVDVTTSQCDYSAILLLASVVDPNTIYSDPLPATVLAVTTLVVRRCLSLPEDVVAEVQTLEPPLLAQQDNHHTSGPVQTLQHRYGYLNVCVNIIKNPKSVKF